MKSKKVPAYDLETLQQACEPGLELRVGWGTATCGYRWIARADPAIAYGSDRFGAWYVKWARGKLASFQAWLADAPRVPDYTLHFAYARADNPDLPREYAHLVGMSGELDIAIGLRLYYALVADRDVLVAVRSGLNRYVLVVRDRVVMASTVEEELPGHTPAIEDTTVHLPDANRYRLPDKSWQRERT